LQRCDCCRYAEVQPLLDGLKRPHCKLSVVRSIASQPRQPLSPPPTGPQVRAQYGEELSYEAVASMTYADAVARETARLCPTSHLLFRRCASPGWRESWEGFTVLMPPPLRSSCPEPATHTRTCPAGR
jgi:hypothetical protein